MIIMEEAKESPEQEQQSVVIQLATKDGHPVQQPDGSTATYVLNTATGAAVQLGVSMEDQGQLVQGHAQVQEVTIAALPSGSKTETATVVALPDGSIVNLQTEPQPEQNVDSSFNYYDNIRGKVNIQILTDLVRKYDAENINLSKNDRLHQWSLVTSEYQQMTGQSTKSRTMLMKRWSSARYYRQNEGKSVDQGGRVKNLVQKAEDSKEQG